MDGTNTTLNSGRILINLKPLDERKLSASEVIRRVQPELTSVTGITLFMQPVQDLTVEDRVSRTQFQPNGWGYDRPRTSAASRRFCIARGERVQQNAGLGLRTKLVYDRATASRLGITPSMIDNTLYDAFGQRQVSTMFYAVDHVPRGARGGPGIPAGSHGSAQPVHPLGRRNRERRSRFEEDGDDGRRTDQLFGRHLAGTLARSILPPAWNTGGTASVSSSAASATAFNGATASAGVFKNGSQVPLSAFTHIEQSSAPFDVVRSPGPVPGLSRCPSKPGARRPRRPPSRRSIKVKADIRQCTASIQAELQGTAQVFQASLANGAGAD